MQMRRVWRQVKTQTVESVVGDETGRQIVYGCRNSIGESLVYLPDEVLKEITIVTAKAAAESRLLMLRK